jgi:hypothetical protein
MKLLGYSIDLNIIILIGILYLIMVVNAISGSCKREGRKNKKGSSSGDTFNSVYNNALAIVQNAGLSQGDKASKILTVVNQSTLSQNDKNTILSTMASMNA